MKGDFVMAEKVREKSKKKKIFVVLGVLLIIMVAFCIWVWASIKHYMETNTWATVQFTENENVVDKGTEFLKGDTYHLHNTTITIGDITHEGQITMKFNPAVKDSETGKLIEKAVFGKDELLKITEICSDGATANWELKVISNQYR